MGAYRHGSDLPYMFDTVESAPAITGKTPKAYALADQMSRAWMAFAPTADPNHRGMPHWPAYNPTTRATIVFDAASKVATSKVVNDL